MSTDKTYGQIFQEVREQVYKNTESYPSDDYVRQWIKEHHLWQPRKLTRDDLSKADLVFQYLDGIVKYEGEMIENIIISLGSEDGAPLIHVQDIRDQFEFEDVAQSLLTMCELLIYVDNPEKTWTPIDPDQLDQFIRQIALYHTKKG